MDLHSKDKDLPDFTRNSRGRPKTPGMSDADAWFADYLEGAMFDHERWEMQQRRAHRSERVNIAVRWITTLGCLGASTLISTAAILGLILLLRYLWGLM